ncbi:MAG TPA: hypothetical protein VES62_12915 [Thermoleophilaceae bacterium]|nr:hypothetical protein [Thermoleophilaceae bacterium]
MPTKHRRHAVTETAPVKQALDELRRETGTDRVPLAELVVLGAGEKVRRIREERDNSAGRQQVAEWIRTKTIPGDPQAAEEVRRTGWTPHT